jgi:hypothetical protein
MTDLTYETRRVCAQNVSYDETVTGSKGDTYHVSFGTENPGDYAANWHCTCAGFSYRAKCRHVEEAKGRKCDAGWQAYAGDPGLDGETCPKCGGPTVVIQVAV